MRENCTSPRPKTQLASTRTPSAGIVVKPNLKGPLNPQSVFNYAFLGRHKPARTAVGENRSTNLFSEQIPSKHRWAAGHCLQPTSPSGKQPRPWKGSGENTGQGLKVSSAPPRRRGYLRHEFANSPEPPVAAWKPLAFKKYSQEWKGGGKKKIKKEMVFAEAHSSAHFHVCQSLLAWL